MDEIGVRVRGYRPGERERENQERQKNSHNRDFGRVTDTNDISESQVEEARYYVALGFCQCPRNQQATCALSATVVSAVRRSMRGTKTLSRA